MDNKSFAHLQSLPAAARPQRKRAGVTLASSGRHHGSGGKSKENVEVVHVVVVVEFLVVRGVNML